MNNLLKKEIDLLIEDDGNMLSQFYNELRQCMGDEDQKMFDSFYSQMSARREERVTNIKNKMSIVYS